MFTIITDESADHHINLGVRKLPFKIILEGREVRMSAEEVCKHIQRGKVLTTSQIPPKVFLEVFKKAEEPIMCITIARTLSGTYTSARIAARMSGKEVVVIDSGTISLGLGLLVEKAVELRKEGKDFDRAVAEIENYKRRIKIYFTLRDLTYLARSGRVSGVFAGLGNFLGINPIMELYMGEARRVKIVRGFERAAQELLKFATGKKALIGYVCAKDIGERLAKSIGTKAIELCPVIACHTGPAVAVGVVE